MDESPLCRALLACRTVWYNPDPAVGTSLGRILTTFPAPDTGYPAVLTRGFIFGQLYGVPGTYTLAVQLVLIDGTGADESATLIDEWGPWDRTVTGFEVYDPITFLIDDVRLGGPGLYEFRLLCRDTEEITDWVRFRAEGSL